MLQEGRRTQRRCTGSRSAVASGRYSPPDGARLGPRRLQMAERVRGPSAARGVTTAVTHLTAKTRDAGQGLLWQRGGWSSSACASVQFAIGVPSALVVASVEQSRVTTDGTRNRKTVYLKPHSMIVCESGSIPTAVPTTLWLCCSWRRRRVWRWLGSVGPRETSRLTRQRPTRAASWAWPWGLTFPR